MVYFLIFIAQIMQFALGTFRTILTARGNLFLNSVVCFIQAVISIIATATVITNVSSDPYKAISYIIGAAVGCYLGIVLDEKLAVGKNMLTIIVDEEDGQEIAKEIRNDGYAVTVLNGKGIEKKRNVLLVGLNRKNEKKIIDKVLKLEKAAVIIDEAITTNGGYYHS